eukprot:CAMPEP_0201525040 /NCGR_PEP_ID=MMETSP0161_2-20130828/26475_1 /ASSEMBLY_ACC=CAM_ASM_000251 /TAXON_ID=180227 /ORGANISM="Neoparamoeba aestuarina, Strain SoJaBio B1-5/56/2" /LENGTH=221 /DNA_ID=CAMNT_0047924761 /DNA_START=27 /DNA_END=689 /DNA_ORIENTATION=-
MAVYEQTDYKIGQLLENEPHDAVPIVKEEVFPEREGIAYCLYNVLSPSECDLLIKKVDEFGYNTKINCDIRVVDRVAVFGEEVANLIFDRVKPFIEVDYEAGKGIQDGIPKGEYEGRWRAVGLNECFRFCRYEKGGFFLPHFDGGFDRSRCNRSIRTFMLYLNNDFGGGKTSFYSDQQQHYSIPRVKNVLTQINAKPGMALVFNSELLHDGGLLESGNKYI